MLGTSNDSSNRVLHKTSKEPIGAWNRSGSLGSARSGLPVGNWVTAIRSAGCILPDACHLEG